MAFRARRSILSSLWSRMLNSNAPALILAPMDGITDAPMRALQGATGAFTFAVSEFLRVSGTPVPKKVFLRDIPELAHGCRTPSGMPVQVQILGGNPERMAASAENAVKAGARAIDINFGCPAPTVNRHDGGASLLQHPCRIREIVAAIRSATPSEISVSAKLRLGWESIEDIHENAEMAAEGGASWLTIHARTRKQGYLPPVYWKPIGQVRDRLSLPIIANGDIWGLDDFKLCQEQTGCRHFMIGRSALANPVLPYEIAAELGIGGKADSLVDWIQLLRSLVAHTEHYKGQAVAKSVVKLKQWLKLASIFGDFKHFEAVKQTRSLEEFFDCLETALAFEKTGDKLPRYSGDCADSEPVVPCASPWR
ncbi:MAG: tRNA-dihydrouridine synthase family protein [Chlorobia bacterium]|nr:tRNA-dihydrouridine synthase family protein [Fimbriimonadaceae bacterium]